MKELESTLNTNETVVSVKDLSISFNGIAVLKKVSFCLNKNENLVIIGKSGSGKSVLIKCLVGLLNPDEGEITLFGKNIENINIQDFNKLRKRIGFLFQSSALYDSMTVGENLAFQLKNDFEGNRAELKLKIQESLASVGLDNLEAKMPSELSGGMRKRLGLARSQILNPELMLYDEPTTGLDPITSKEISELILTVKHETKCSSIIITHDLNCARITSDRILILKNGGIESEGTFEALSQSKDKWIKSMFE